MKPEDLELDVVVVSQPSWLLPGHRVIREPSEYRRDNLCIFSSTPAKDVNGER